MQLKITYCVPCGYLKRVESLKSDLEKTVKGLNVSLEKGSRGIFDVHADDELIFSKQRESRFLDADELIKLLK